MVGGLFHNMSHNLDFLVNSSFSNLTNFSSHLFFPCREKISTSTTTSCKRRTNTTSPKSFRAFQLVFFLTKQLILSTKLWYKKFGRHFSPSNYQNKRNFYFFKIHNGPPHPSNYGYSYAKRLIDVANKGYYEQFGKKYTSVIPCNVFGPNDNFHPNASHVIPGLMRKLYDLVQSGN